MIVRTVFGLWTLFVWGGRLRNLVQDEGGLTQASRWSLVGSVLFTVLAVLLLAAVGLARRADRSAGGDGTGRPGPGLAERPAVGVLAALTVGVWSVRAVDIALEDHEPGFIVVHVVLALVSMTLAALAVRSLRSGLTPELVDRGRPPVRYPAPDG